LHSYQQTSWLATNLAHKLVADDFSLLFADDVTPMVAQVLGSYSWSVNLAGTKKWTMFPPDQESALSNKHGKRVSDIRDVNHAEFPGFATAVRIEFVHGARFLNRFIPLE
jgi:hypothetical protein